MAVDPEIRRHQEWLGFLQPVGVTVTPTALVAAQARVNANVAGLQERYKNFAEDGRIADFAAFCREFLEWPAEMLVCSPGDTLDVRLPEYGETLSPTHAVRDPEDRSKWQLLIRMLPDGVPFDESESKEKDRWHASPQARFERLLRETKVSTGLLVSPGVIRLVHAPSGESSGYLSFPVEAMGQIPGRPILAAFHLLFYFDRLFQLPAKQRLPAILKESREFQNQVSTRLAEQVLEALHELLRGFRQADWDANRELLREVLARSPNDVYGGLLTTLMRLVFLLYAEERGLLPSARAWVQNYSVSNLFVRLRDDARHHPDTMDLRYGAWAQLLTVFRVIYDGAQHGDIRLPARHGKLFDRVAYPFLEGSGTGVPKISDGVVWRVLEKLLVLDSERLSYRALDVEQIGSVYEAMMGFDVRMAHGPVVALKPHDVCVDLDHLLQMPGKERSKYLRDVAACDITGDDLAYARALDPLIDAIRKRVSGRTPEPLPPGSLYLQPTEERRRSGSHYTPRSLTEPIVKTTLEPILNDLGDSPKPEQILGLKVCDPAMGSGAFLVAACRLLGDRLMASWAKHGVPSVPAGDDLFLHARRLVAQNCLYGVDKNPFAVDLAKLSLWLATMARDHAFTFLDHTFRCGDSLVGLTREQIASFHWAPEAQIPLIRGAIDKAVRRADDLRAKIRGLAASDDTDAKARLLADVDAAVKQVRLVGDAAIAAFFGGAKDKDRRALRAKHEAVVHQLLNGRTGVDALAALSAELRSDEKPVPPFHWEIEFPEVFLAGGFDAIVGNPPFAGKNTTAEANATGYPDWLKAIHEHSHGNADLVAHFYRRAFNLLGPTGAFGLIATKTIGQGDTRSTGLRWICTNGGTIYNAQRRIKWPGTAAVVVSIVHVRKGEVKLPHELDRHAVPLITAYLFHSGGHDDPAVLQVNANKSFQGSIVLGMGFTFDDTDTNGVASPIAEMVRLVKKDPRNKERIFPYIGGEEVTTHPTHQHHRYVIDFEEMSEERARGWPDLFSIVENTKGTRGDHSTAPWWQFERRRGEMYYAIRDLKRVLVHNFTSQYLAFAFLPTGAVYANTVTVFAYERFVNFAVLQSRPHEIWARFFASSLEDRLRYTPSDCFETFPLPENFEKNAVLEKVGREYYESRGKLMVRNNEGLTKTYNRFHDPEERSPEIAELRELHAAMDRAVLDAYGWKDLLPKCDFILDYEEEEEEGRSRKKPWRYRWIDADRDEILARLLALNKKRAEAEALAGAGAIEGKLRRKKGKSSPSDPQQPSLF